MTKKIVLERVGYRITGRAAVTLWGGDRGYIEMKSYVIPELTKEKILDGANDNGFGVYSIDGLEVYVHEMYENGYVGDYVGFVKFEDDECVMSDVPEITVDVKKEVIK